MRVTPGLGLPALASFFARAARSSMQRSPHGSANESSNSFFEVSAEFTKLRGAQYLRTARERAESDVGDAHNGTRPVLGEQQ